jgi:hypothetical protein
VHFYALFPKSENQIHSNCKIKAKMKFQKKVFIDILRANKSNGIDLCKDMINKNSRLKTLSDKEEVIFDKMLKLLHMHLKEKMKKISKKPTEFEKANLDWIKSDFEFDFKEKVKRKESSQDPLAKGAPNKSFEESASATKRTKISKHSDLSQNNIQLGLASVQLSAKRNKNLDLQKILKAVIENPQNVIDKLMTQSLVIMSPSEGLEFLLHLNLSKFQYLQMRNESKSRGADLYPTYDEILKAKAECRPEEISVSETLVEVSYKSLIRHTTQRIFKIPNPTLNKILKETQGNSTDWTIRFNTGFDGATGYSRYDQKFQTNSENQYEDGLISVVLTPLSLTYKNQIVWSNPVPQSIKFVRPVMFEFAKETTQKILQIKSWIDRQVEEIETIAIETSEDNFIVVQPEIRLTAIDGKIRTVITGLLILMF